MWCAACSRLHAASVNGMLLAADAYAHVKLDALPSPVRRWHRIARTGSGDGVKPGLMLSPSPSPTKRVRKHARDGADDSVPHAHARRRAGPVGAAERVMSEA